MLAIARAPVESLHQSLMIFLRASSEAWPLVCRRPVTGRQGLPNYRAVARAMLGILEFQGRRWLQVPSCSFQGPACVAEAMTNQ